MATVPYVARGEDGNYESQFHNSFENTYTTLPLSELNKKRLMFLPLVVQTKNGTKICITEADLENYPGLYLSSAEGGNSLSGVQPHTLKQPFKEGTTTYNSLSPPASHTLPALKEHVHFRGEQ